MSLQALKGVVVFLFTENVFLSLLGSFFNLYQIFLGTSFIFVFGRIFFDIMGLCDFRTLNLWENGYMTEKDATALLMTLLLFLLATSLAWILYLPYSRKLNIISIKDHDQAAYSKITHIVQWAYYALLFLSIIKSAVIISQVKQNGYLWLFNGGIETYRFPLILRTQTLTEAVFLFLLFYNRDRAQVIKNMLLYMIYLGISMLSGQRGPAFTSLLLLMWIYSTYYRKMRIGTVIMIGASSLFVIPFVLWFREGIISKATLYTQLYAQGISLLVLAGTIRFKDIFTNKYPFIIGYFADYFTGLFDGRLKAGQNMDRIRYGNYLGDHLTYALSPEKYLNGNGTGTSIIAEFYEFADGNKIVFFLVSFLFMLIVLIVAHRLYKNIFCFVILYHVIYRFIYSPRDSIFKSISMISLFIPMAVLFKVIERKRTGETPDVGNKVIFNNT